MAKDVGRIAPLAGYLAAEPMAKSITVTLTAVLLGSLASCASSNPEPSPRIAPHQLTKAPSQESMMIDVLASLRTQDEIRACLRDGLTHSELSRVGFDQVTIGECIDRVVLATLDDRSGAGDPAARRRLTDSLELYFAATREAAVRRSAGAASCLPQMR